MRFSGKSSNGDNSGTECPIYSNFVSLTSGHQYASFDTQQSYLGACESEIDFLD